MRWIKMNRHVRVCFTNQQTDEELWKFIELPDGQELLDHEDCVELLRNGWRISANIEIPASDSD